MVAVVILLQLCHHLPRRQLVGLSQTGDAVLHVVQQFRFRYAADAGIVILHGDVADIVQFAEDAELREFRDAGEEDEAQIWVAVFERTVEIAHDVAHSHEL